MFFLIPETKDRTLEEIDELFEEKIPARRFKQYNCTRVQNSAAIGMSLCEVKRDKGSDHVEKVEIVGQK